MCLVSSDSVTPWTIATRLLSLWNFPSKNTGVVYRFPFPRDLPDSGVKLGSPAYQADSLPSESPRKPSFPIMEHSNLFGKQP